MHVGDLVWEKKVQKMGGFQVCNEARKALLAHKQTRASVMSVQKNEAVEAERGARGTQQTGTETKALTSAVHSVIL